MCIHNMSMLIYIIQYTYYIYTGNVNMSALMEYLRKDAQYRIRLNELEYITEERNNMRKIYEVSVVYYMYVYT